MKKSVLLIFSLCAALLLHAQVSKTVNLTEAGTLSKLLTKTQKSTITQLTLTGNIDARDFKTMRDSMTLANINMTEAKVLEYTGNNGTGRASQTYPANTIPAYAFDNWNTKLTTISLPNTVTTIGDYAFFLCRELVSCKMPVSVTAIGNEAFNACYNLSIDTLSNSILSIGDYAFYACKASKITLPNAIKSIGIESFNNIKLSSDTIFIPSSLTSIGVQAFKTWHRNIYYVVDAASTSFASSQGVLFNKDFSELVAFSRTKVGTYEIPNTVKTIRSCAFSSSDSITSLVIPNSVTTIGDSVFSWLSDIKTLQIPSSVTSIGFNSFCNLMSIYVTNPNPIKLSTYRYYYESLVVFVPIGSKALYEAAEGWKNFRILEIGSKIDVLTTSVDLTSATTATICIATTEGWTASCDQSWLTITPTSGNSIGTVFLSAKPNISGTTRTATITISPKVATNGEAKKIIVTQPTADVVIKETEGNVSVSTDTILLSNTATAKLAIITPNKWTVSSDKWWADMSTTSGEGDGEVIIKLQANTTQENRSAIITTNIIFTPKADQGPFSLVVIQAPTTTAIEDTQATATNLLYPNPASSSISIPTTTAARVFVYNSTGQLVLSKDIAGKEDVNIEALTAGLYKVCIETAAGVAVYSVVKK